MGGKYKRWEGKWKVMPYTNIEPNMAEFGVDFCQLFKFEAIL